MGKTRVLAMLYFNKLYIYTTVTCGLSCASFPHSSSSTLPSLLPSSSAILLALASLCFLSALPPPGIRIPDFSDQQLRLLGGVRGDEDECESEGSENEDSLHLVRGLIVTLLAGPRGQLLCQPANLTSVASVCGVSRPNLCVRESCV